MFVPEGTRVVAVDVKLAVALRGLEWLGVPCEAPGRLLSSASSRVTAVAIKFAVMK